MTTERVDVAIVGGGPAGAITASLLAAAGRAVVVLEQSPTPHWRACGVFTSPASTAALRAIGLDRASLDALARPIPAMRVEPPGSPPFRLTYGDDGSLRAPAAGFDRPALDGHLLDLAARRGAVVRRGARVTEVAPPLVVVRDGERERRLEARIVVGADGIRSIVARSAGVNRSSRLGPRVGLTFHVRDPRPPAAHDARMIVLDGAYCGLAPVPGGRLNVGIVLASPARRAGLARDGAPRTVEHILRELPPTDDDPVAWADQDRCDRIEGAAPLAHAVRHRAGDGWLLIGDAAGFLDPFTGEGLHRAIVSAELAAHAIQRALDGDAAALSRYDRAMTARFTAKDFVTTIVQLFLARPSALAYAGRRLAARSGVRETMGLVMGDLVPARRALDPRFLVALLRP